MIFFIGIVKQLLFMMRHFFLLISSQLGCINIPKLGLPRSFHDKILHAFFKNENLETTLQLEKLDVVVSKGKYKGYSKVIKKLYSRPTQSVYFGLIFGVILVSKMKHFDYFTLSYLPNATVRPRVIATTRQNNQCSLKQYQKILRILAQAREICIFRKQFLVIPDDFMLFYSAEQQASGRSGEGCQACKWYSVSNTKK